MLGHKIDFMLIRFRDSLERLKATELQIAQLRLYDFFEQTTSYLSVVELGLYESSVKTFRQLQEKGIEPNTPEWNAAIEETRKRQTEAMRPRLFPQIPTNRYVCFYPMARNRGDATPSYPLPIQTPPP